MKEIYTPSRKIRIILSSPELTEEEAINLAVEIIWETCGDLVRETSDGIITKWNEDSKFLKAYLKFWDKK